MRDGSQTKKRLERCALELFVKKGVSATTIKDIANGAKMAEGTLYRHYSSKEELAHNLFWQSYIEVSNELKNISEQFPTLAKKLKMMTHYFCQRYDEDPVLFNYLLLTQHTQIKTTSETTMTAHEFFTALFNDGIKKKECEIKDADFCAAVLMGIVLQAAISRVHGRITRSMMSDADKLVNAIYSALHITVT